MTKPTGPITAARPWESSPEVLAKTDVQARLKVSLPTVNRLLATGQLASFKCGRRRLIPAESLRAYISAQMEKAARLEGRAV